VMQIWIPHVDMIHTRLKTDSQQLMV